MTQPGNVLDVIIIGGGPAGLSAAIWCADLGLDAILLDRGGEAGGNLLNIHNPISNYPGITASNGRELRDLLWQHAVSSKTPMLFSSPVRRIGSGLTTLELETGEFVRGRNILLATGVRRRTLGLDGEERFKGNGILDSGARSAATVAGMRVAVIGGGDAAAENAAILAQYAEHVYLIHRRPELTARKELSEQAISASNVTLLSSRNVKSLQGKEKLESIVIAGPAGKTEELKVDRIIFRIGVVPNSELVAGIVQLDDKGYVLTDNCGRTSVENIFAAGDVASPLSPTIVTAAGQAAAAIKVIRSRTQ